MSLRGSLFSIGSRMMLRQDDDIQFDVMTYEELQQIQDDLLQKIWMLTLENDVYERYLTRQDPQIMKNITHLLERSKYARRMTSHTAPMRSSRMSFRESIMSLHDPGRQSVISTPSLTSVLSGSRRGTSSLLTMKTSEGPKINMAHRIVMATKEVEEMKKNLEEFKETAKRRKARMRAEIEELEIRISEVREAGEEFEEEVVARGVDPITGKIPAERVTRFVEEWLRSANTIVERLRLKSSTIKMQIRKTRQQLIQREQIGEALHAVDFEQLNIQNKDYARTIEEKSHYVLEMKKIAGHYHLKLTQRRQKLCDLLSTLNSVKKEISLKREQIEELKVEQVNMVAVVSHMNEQLSRLLDFMENHTVPDILDFVKLTAELEELQKTYKLLERRRNIERIIYQISKKQIPPRSKIALLKKRSKHRSDTKFPVAVFDKTSSVYIDL